MNKKRKWSPPLPDTSLWQPRKDMSETLQGAFLKRCQATEQLILLRAKIEQEMNLDNFDSGSGIEDIVREQFMQLLPDRYSIRAGVINDRRGNTCGDFDLILFNDFWFPAIKGGATPESRRFHFPIEGVYGVVEIKRTLNFQTLDQAMEKLVACHRLERSRTFANRLVENRDYDSCFHGLTNPLYSAILATGLGPRMDLDVLVERFYDINRSLKRLEVVRALCVLGNGTVTWAFLDDNREIRPARFMRDDLFHPIFPAYSRAVKSTSALYALISDLLLHLYHSVLAAEDLAVSYGPLYSTAVFPASPEIALDIDTEWLDTLDEEYGEDQVRVKRNPLLSKEHIARVTAMRHEVFKTFPRQSKRR